MAERCAESSTASHWAQGHLNTAGIRTTAHSEAARNNVPTRDAHTVKKWADAGTVMLGKLATHEFRFRGRRSIRRLPARNPLRTASIFRRLHRRAPAPRSQPG